MNGITANPVRIALLLTIVLFITCAHTSTAVETDAVVSDTTLYGDANADGILDHTDAELLVRYSCGKSVSIPADSADVSGDSTLSALDAALVLMRVADSTYVFPVEGGTLPVLPEILVAGPTDSATTLSFPEIEIDPYSIGEAGLDVMIPIFATGENIYGVDLAFRTGRWRAQLDSVYVVSHAFEGMTDVVVDWNVVSDTAYVSIASSEPVNLSGTPICTMLFTLPPEARYTGCIGLDYPLDWLSHRDETNINELSPVLEDGNLRIWPTGDIASSDRPDHITLKQNAPNPFNPSTTIRYSLRDATHVRLDVYDITGKHVRSLVDADVSAGWHSVKWDGRDALGRPVASGVYVNRLHDGKTTLHRRMLLVR
jgi:hypothetical protein